MDWFVQNLATIIAGLVLAAIVAVIVMVKIRQRKKGGCACGCPGCTGGCPHAAVSNQYKMEAKKDAAK